MSLFERLKAAWTGDTPPAAAGGPEPGGAAQADGESPDMATCHEAITVLQEFLDGELEGESRARVTAHFDICKRCYPNLMFEKSFRDAVGRAARGEATTPEIRARVMDALAELTSEGETSS